jgi:hypothetical protein
VCIEEIYKGMDFTLDVAHHPVRDKLVFEIGIDVGGMADHQVLTHGCELTGIDLSYAVASAYPHYGKTPFLH